MAQDQAVPAPSVREDIVRALAGIQATPKHLASTLGLPARVVRDELEAMGREQITAVKTHRSGERLYRLRDAVDPRWDTLRGPALTLQDN